MRVARIRGWLSLSTLVVALALASAASATIPKAHDYHSLLVLRSDPNTLLLGTHTGLYRSTDGGRTWTKAGLAGEDVMNLVDAGNGTILMGGHMVYAISTDGGKTWHAERPKGLPDLDVHGLAADPRDRKTIYAQVAMQGLYRSTDEGRSYKLVSSDVNGMMMQVAVTPAGSFVVGDMSRGIFLSSPSGKHWRNTAHGAVLGLAVDPSNPKRIVATGGGIAISNDGGRTWKAALRTRIAFGAIAWSPQNSNLVYAVGYNRTLWRSLDGGEHWSRFA